MDEKNCRMCNVCQGRGYISMSREQKALIILGDRLADVEGLAEKIITCLRMVMLTENGIVSLIQRYNQEIEELRIQYELVNLVESGQIAYDQSNGRYRAVN